MSSNGLSQRGSLKFYVGGVISIVILMGGLGAVYVAHGSPAKAAASPVVRAVATVGGEVVTEADLAAALGAGVDRAVAVDRAIDREVAANLARQAYANEADLALKAVQRDVLAQLFVAKRTEALRAQVTKADVAAYYAKNVATQDFREYRLNLLVTQDAARANDLAAAVESGRIGELAAQFSPVAEGRYVRAAALPYGLGEVVKLLKPGSYSRPLTTRSGVMVLQLVDLREGVKPTVEQAATEIKDLIVAQRLADEIKVARSRVVVELKS